MTKEQGLNITPSSYWQKLEPGMFPTYEEALSGATNAHFRMISVLDYLEVEDWIEHSHAPKVESLPLTERFFSEHSFQKQS
jgi:hypothetical protein